MKRTTMALVGVLAVVGGAAAVAQVAGQGNAQGGPMGDGMRQGRGMMGEGDWRGRGPRGHDAGDHRGRGDRMDRRARREPTEAELDARIRERFARLDRNSDGVIDAQEIEQAIADRQSGREADPQLMTRLDTDKDGKVAKAEYLARVEVRFKRMDLNNDGRITDDDLPPMLRGRGILKGDAVSTGRGARGMQWLREADANKDGLITLDEVRARAEQRFALLDRTKDGVLDPADRDAMQKEMAQYRVQRFLHDHGADKDGKVTREQFAQAEKQRVAERGAMGDGMRGPDGDGMRGPDGGMGMGMYGRGRHDR